MNSLRTIFRCMLLVWLVLVAALGFAVSRGTHTTYAGNTMAFLFSSAGREKVELPPVERRAVPPVAEEPHAEPPAPEWTPLAKGKTAGGGTLGAPEIQTLDGGAVAVVMSLTGTIGDVSFYEPEERHGRYGRLHRRVEQAAIFQKIRELRLPLARAGRGPQGLPARLGRRGARRFEARSARRILRREKRRARSILARGRGKRKIAVSSIRFLERLRAMQHGSERANFEDVNEVLRSVIGYVSKLLNTRRGSSVLDEEFGIPDFTGFGVSYSRDDIPRIEKEIARFIERCEPRLRDVKITYSPDPNEPFSINFVLDAKLVLTGTDVLPVKLTTRINPSGKVSVTD